MLLSCPHLPNIRGNFYVMDGAVWRPVHQPKELSPTGSEWRMCGLGQMSRRSTPESGDLQCMSETDGASCASARWRDGGAGAGDRAAG